MSAPKIIIRNGCNYVPVMVIWGAFDFLKKTDYGSTFNGGEIQNQFDRQISVIHTILNISIKLHPGLDPSLLFKNLLICVKAHFNK